MGTLLAHIQPAVNELLQTLSCSLSGTLPQICSVALVAEAQNPALVLVEPWNCTQFISLIEIPLKSLPILRQINCLICRLTDGALSHLVQISNQDIIQGQLQY